MAELAALIQSALERPLPNSDLVLTKRAEIVEANQQLTARVQQLQTLFEIGKSVTSQLELEEVLRRVAADLPTFGETVEGGAEPDDEQWRQIVDSAHAALQELRRGG